MKKLAAALGGKTAQMMKPAEAERISGYRIGGVSPFGQTRRLRTAFDADALGEPYVFVNGGQRGLQARLDPRDAARLLEAVVAPLTA
jgi:Cys-tRNA(Pro)/Cys-tRNA(Cys) deacylase